MYAISAKVDTKDASCSCECAGVITAVGDNVSEFKTGDRVVAMAPGHFATVERFPNWAVCKMSDEEDFTVSDRVLIRRQELMRVDDLHYSDCFFNGYLWTEASGEPTARRGKCCGTSLQ